MSGDAARISLGFFPTPLQELKRLSSYLQGPHIWMKRDDCTGLGLGGNKVRKLEYILAHALQQEADVLITVGAVTSNHARQTAAAAARMGMECHLVLIGREPSDWQGNYLLDKLLGARTVCVPNKLVESTVQQIIDDCKKRGQKPYYIPAGGHTLQGCLAYMDCFAEITEQADFHIDAVVDAIGTGTTHAGLVLGQRALNHGAEIIGISVGGSRNWCHEEIISVLRQGEELKGLPPGSSSDLHIEDAYIGEGYTKPYQELRDIIYLLARLEGIFLDPVYTGKAMVGLVNMIKQKRFRPDQNIVFLHSGGAPELFNYHGFLSKGQPEEDKQ